MIIERVLKKRDWKRRHLDSGIDTYQELFEKQKRNPPDVDGTVFVTKEDFKRLGLKPKWWLLEEEDKDGEGPEHARDGEGGARPLERGYGEEESEAGAAAAAAWAAGGGGPAAAEGKASRRADLKSNTT